MSLTLSIHDAATNCRRDGAVAIISLKSGVVLKGFLEKPVGSLTHEGETIHLKTPTGWVTALFSEVASVEATRAAA